MKSWIVPLLMLALGIAGFVSCFVFDFSMWILLPSIVLVLLGLMPFDAARHQMLEQIRARRESEHRSKENGP